jgi:DNA-binding LacI/PurR family transcriptional regulator
MTHITPYSELRRNGLDKRTAPSRGLDPKKLVQELRDKIAKGRLPEGRLPTLSELEQGKDGLRAGRYASRLAFKLLAEEGLIEFRGKLGTFVRSNRMRNQARSTRLIGLIIPIMHFEFIGKVTEGILKELDEVHNAGKSINQRYRIITACSQGDCKREGDLLKELVNEVDGIILFPVHNHQVQAGDRDAEPFTTVVQSKVPLILIVRKPEFPEFSLPAPVASFPEDEIAKRVAAHVAKAMEQWKPSLPRSVFVVGERRNSMHETRVRRIWNALTVQFAGGHPDVSVVMEEEPLAIREQAGQRVASRLLERGEFVGKKTLIVCTTDLIAIGVIRKMRDAENLKPSIKIPDNVMVMGVGGDILGAYVRPTLTTLELKPGGLGKKIVTTMIQMIEGDPAWQAETPEVFGTIPDTIGNILHGESTGGGPRADQVL